MTKKSQLLSAAVRRMSSACAVACVVLGAGLSSAQAAVVNILPIQICDDGGASCANAGQELFLAETNKIWAQAGISFNYLPFTTTNSSAFLSLDDQAEVASLFSVAPGAATQPMTISMWFVANHFDAFGEVNMIGGDKIVIDEIIFSVGRLDTIAHELGHLLGLNHEDTDPGVETDFLMRSGADRITPNDIGDITPDGLALDKLTAAQILTANASPLVVPEPGTLLLLGSSFGTLMLGRRQAKKRSA